MRIRRTAVLLLLVALLPATVLAAPAKIALIAPSPPILVEASKAIGEALKKQGLVADRDFTFEVLSAAGDASRLPALAQQAVKDGAAVIVTSSYPAARAAKAATSTIPIVIFNAGEPEETGLIASLAHPGGNLTGLSDMSADLSAKRLQLLKEAVPSLKRTAMLFNADDAGMVTRYKAASAVAPKLGVTLEPFGVREPDDFGGAFDKMAANPPDGILMVTDVLTILNRKRVIDFAAARKIPAIYELDLFAKDGGLMAYGPNQKEMLNRAATLVARVLKGAKAGDLPFEQPTLFEFTINRKTADAIGLKLPPALLARADKVIE
ncbi:MAG TPA: ABC transporter substrate-binding protein [Reyranella sp.]|nr:ABC transporter substrate-binding protein [Reyranella sp.]